jgi:SAM-dependent methyltransferase
MEGLVDAALANPWATLDTVLEGPLHPGGREATEALLDRAEVDGGTRLLEVGCGAGEALSVASERGAQAWGVDPDPGADRAIVADGTALPVADDAVDVVLAECVLCLTDLSESLAETRRVLDEGGRLALSDVVVEGEEPAVPEAVAEALCLSGARSEEYLLGELETAGFTVESVADHHEDLLAMRDRLQQRVDYEALLGAMGERGQRILDQVEAAEAAVEEDRIGYVSVVASA